MSTSNTTDRVIVLHPSLPQTYTAERLGQWIDLHKASTKSHYDEVPYTEEEIREFERKSSVASRSIDKLDSVLEYVKELLKKGTPWDSTQEVHLPVNVNVPPTQGTDTLRKNRQWADQQIEKGFKQVETKLFIIPDPDKLRMVAVTIQGEEMEQYSRDMTKDEVKQYGKPILTGDSAKGLDIKFTGTDEKGRMNFDVTVDDKPAKEADRLPFDLDDETEKPLEL